MKFFSAFFFVATLVCGYFFLTDGPGSGMMYPTLIFAALGGGTLLYNLLRNGNSLNDKAGQ